MPSIAARPHCTPEQYLEMERTAHHRSEYLNGQVVALAGANRRHNLIAVNVCRELSRQLIGRPCEAYMNDMRVKVGPTGLYTYPDVVVACNEIHFEDAREDTLLNPVLIVEVLSASTEAYDRGEKFAHYRRLASLSEYVLVAQDRVRIEYYLRQGSRWVLREAGRLDDTIRLESIECDVALRDVYDKVEVAKGNEATPSPHTTEVGS
jgi:Uma2 family endonuclease